jgi:hypothetical protein
VNRKSKPWGKSRLFGTKVGYALQAMSDVRYNVWRDNDPRAILGFSGESCKPDTSADQDVAATMPISTTNSGAASLASTVARAGA